MFPDLSEHRIETEQVVEGKFIRMHTDRVRLPDGSESHREYVLHPGAVVIAAFVGNNADAEMLVFEHQYRYPLGRHFIELPAGKIDAGEAQQETAQRELLEETGYVSDTWQHALTMHPTIGYANEHIELYIAKNVTYVGHQRDEGEFLEVFMMSLSDAVERIGRGEITDTKTAFSLLWLDRFRDRWR
ncbi:MAG: NUDIX hydrolase [Aeromicrobium sp.]|nr:NUDIX hydrolase [Burkholderiales bacterium]